MNVSLEFLTGGIVMHITLVFALFTIMMLGAPANAQNPCVDCLKVAQEHLKQYLGDAISHEDKNSCTVRQQAKAKVSENGECVIERTASQNHTDILSQKK
jgi:hypothetical protein